MPNGQLGVLWWRSASPRRDILFLWFGYGGGVACGLMAIGHAAGIASALDYKGALWIAPAAIAVSNFIGSLVAGRLADKISSAGLLLGLPILSAAGVSASAISGDAVLLIPCLFIIGFAYGGIIAAYPAAIRKIFGVLKGPAIYGRVFTAWGSAGLVAPWLAGQLFDLTGTYRLALFAAGFFAIVSFAAIIMYFARAAKN